MLSCPILHTNVRSTLKAKVHLELAYDVPAEPTMCHVVDLNVPFPAIPLLAIYCQLYLLYTATMEKSSPIMEKLHNLIAGATGSEQIGFLDTSKQSLYGMSRPLPTANHGTSV